MTTPTPDLPDWTRTSAIVDSPQLIIDTAGLVPMPYNSPTVDVSRFRSVRVIPTVAGGAAGNFAVIGVAWQQDAEQGPGDQYSVWDGASGKFTPTPPAIYLPVRGNQLSVNAEQIAGASGISLKVYGSLLDQPAPAVLGLNTPQPGVLAYGAFPALAAGAIVHNYCGPTDGDVYLWLNVASGTAELVLTGNIQDTGANTPVQLAVIGPISGALSLLRAPAAGMALDAQVRNTGAGTANVNFSVVQAH